MTLITKLLFMTAKDSRHLLDL